jgi:drug/metabolite transporter (DMT)-like permease
MKKSNVVKGYLYSVLSAVIYGLMPLMAKFIYAEGVNAMTLVFLRNLLALPSLALLAYWQQKSLKVEKKAFYSIGLLSFLGCSLTPFLLFLSYQYLPSGTATVFHFVYPSLVVIFGFFFLKQKVGKGTLVSILLCFLGILFFYDPSGGFHPLGAALALGSGVTFALNVLLLSRFRKFKDSGFLFTFYIVLWSALVTFVICLCTGSLAFPVSLKGWILALVFSLSVTTGAVVLFQQGVFLIGGEKTAIVSTLEPITGVVVGILVFQESCHWKVLLGSVLVIAASLLIAVMDMKKKKGEEENGHQ